MSQLNSDTNGFNQMIRLQKYRSVWKCRGVRLAKNTDHWRPVANTVMNIVFHNKSENSWLCYLLSYNQQGFWYTCLVYKQQRIQSSSVLIFKKHCDLLVVATIPVLYYRGTWLKLLSGLSGDTQCVGQKIVHFTDMLNKRKWTNNRTVVNCHMTYWQPSFHIVGTAGLRQRFHDATTKTQFLDHNAFKLQTYSLHYKHSDWLKVTGR
jgi:hypothetical protein